MMNLLNKLAARLLGAFGWAEIKVLTTDGHGLARSISICCSPSRVQMIARQIANAGQTGWVTLPDGSAFPIGPVDKPDTAMFEELAETILRAQDLPDDFLNQDFDEDEDEDEDDRGF